MDAIIIKSAAKDMESSGVFNANHVESSGTSNLTPAPLSLEQRFHIVRSVGEECFLEDALLNLLAKKPEPVFTLWFQPSGRMRIDQGIMTTIDVNKLTSFGCKVKIVIADWSAMLNNNLGGDLKKINVVGHYLIENWKAAGMNVDGGKVEVLWSSEEINARADEYLPLVMDISLKNTIEDLRSCSQIRGQCEEDESTGAHVIDPCMQCADIFFFKADICQLGMVQSKVYELAGQYCDDIKRENKPIILSHHTLPGLHQRLEKISKIDPSSYIFMDDDVAEVNSKIKRAYCPPKIVKGNPCLEYVKHLIIPQLNVFSVERSVQNGGNKTFKSFEEVLVDYESGELHPADLKPALAKSLNIILEPVREHFKKDKNAKDMPKRVKAYSMTN